MAGPKKVQVKFCTVLETILDHFCSQIEVDIDPPPSSSGGLSDAKLEQLGLPTHHVHFTAASSTQQVIFFHNNLSAGSRGQFDKVGRMASSPTPNFWEDFCSVKVGCRQRAQMKRAISMKNAQLSTFMKLTPRQKKLLHLEFFCTQSLFGLQKCWSKKHFLNIFLGGRYLQKRPKPHN